MFKKSARLGRAFFVTLELQGSLDGCSHPSEGTGSMELLRDSCGSQVLQTQKRGPMELQGNRGA